MHIVVIGGGPAGMMAAITAAEGGSSVTLIEKNEKLGKKLFLTGKGRCNLTNACPAEELFDNIRTNPKFLYSAFHGLDNATTVDLFNKWGLRTKVERGNRVFPQSDHSSDVIKALRLRLEKLGVRILLNTRVMKLITEDDPEGCSKISAVIIKNDPEKEKIMADRVIMACGGKSYPGTGSDASYTDLLKDTEVRIIPSEPSLVPFVVNDSTVKDMQGLSLKNIALSVYTDGREKYSGFGEMLFTHFGISGPLVLTSSTYLREDDYKQDVRVYIDLKPALSEEELDARILRDFSENMNRILSNSLGKLLPSKIITAVIKKSGINPLKKINSVSRQERKALCQAIKSFDIKVEGNRGFDEAVITRGGVDVRDINPSTMECRKIKGLYFAGEMIDTDALTGGFNLQIAWSTGFAAGHSAASDARLV